MKDSIQYIAAGIKAARLERGMSQRALSAKTKIPQSHISLIENGKVNLETSSLIEILRSLEMELMIIPRNLVPIIEALQRKHKQGVNEQIPLYQLDPDDVDEITD